MKKNLNSQLFQWLKLPLSLLILIYLGLFSITTAQQPRNVPPADDYQPFQVDPTLGVIIYIVLPLFFLILFILWRRREKKRKIQKRNDLNK